MDPRRRSASLSSVSIPWMRLGTFSSLPRTHGRVLFEFRFVSFRLFDAWDGPCRRSVLFVSNSTSRVCTGRRGLVSFSVSFFSHGIGWCGFPWYHRTRAILLVRWCVVSSLPTPSCGLACTYLSHVPFIHVIHSIVHVQWCHPMLVRVWMRCTLFPSTRLPSPGRLPFLVDGWSPSSMGLGRV